MILPTDFSEKSYYYITICIKNRRTLLWENETLSTLGERAQRCGIAFFERPTAQWRLICMKVMPNHVHFLFSTPPGGKKMRLHLNKQIDRFKERATTKEESSIWQKQSYLQKVRNQDMYIKIYDHITMNPDHWIQDQFYNL